MTIPIGIQGSIRNSGRPGHRVVVQSGDCIRIRAADVVLRLPSGQLAWEEAT